jgi:hypothetical protein
MESGAFEHGVARCGAIVATQRQQRRTQLASTETGAERKGKRPETTADAERDGDDVNSDYPIGEWELQSHPEAQRQPPWFGRDPTSFL